MRGQPAPGVIASNELCGLGERLTEEESSIGNSVFIHLSVTLACVIVPLLSMPVSILSGILIVLSILLAASILLHKGRGGGMSDLFGGGMSTSMGGVSRAERRLDLITLIVGLLWLLNIVALLLLYRAEAF